MCIFTRPIKEVEQTKIFARAFADGRQALVYSMLLTTAQPTAMVLPIPVPAGTDEEAVSFVSFAHYTTFFSDLERCFPSKKPLAASKAKAASKQPRPASLLVVHRVGSFVASFVPTVGDFSRLDPRFRLPRGVLARHPSYRDYGFVVFQLSAGDAKVHPMAFVFHRADRSRLFFPTVHHHGKETPVKAHFDHLLYAQGAGLSPASRRWRRSEGRASNEVYVERTHGLLDPSRVAFRRRMGGLLLNRDTWLAIRGLSGQRSRPGAA